MRKYAIWLVSLSAVLAFGCGIDRLSKATCQRGSERCVCYRNKACDRGLTCMSNVCVTENSSDVDDRITGDADANSDAGGAFRDADAGGSVVPNSASGDGGRIFASARDAGSDFASQDSNRNDEGGSAGSGGLGATGGTAGSSGLGAAGSDDSNVSIQPSCELTCDTNAIACTSVCISRIDPAAIQACQNDCARDNVSCSAQCASGNTGSSGTGNTKGIGGSSCELTCDAAAVACNSMCTAYLDETAVRDCQKNCVQSKDACDAQC